ncbi:hypothetical protein ARSEF4850_005325 [Beauveria asiatica]
MDENASSMSAQIEQFLDESADLVKVIRSWTMHKTDNEPLSGESRPLPCSCPSTLSKEHLHLGRRPLSKRPLAGSSRRQITPPTASATRSTPAPTRRAPAFEAQTRKTLTEGKFHAKVQLLCQTCPSPRTRRPASSAPARTPMLEQRIRSSAAAALLQSVGAGRQRRRGRRQHLYPDPCESTCSTAMRSDTTVAGKSAGSADGGPLEDGSSASESSAAKDDSVPSKTSCSSSSMASLRAAEESQHLTGEEAAALMEKDGSLDISSSRNTVRLVEKKTTQSLGEVVASSIPPNTASKMYTAGLLRVQLEYTNTRHRAGDDDDDDDDQTHLKYQIQQLTAHEARTLREGSSRPIYI